MAKEVFNFDTLETLAPEKHFKSKLLDVYCDLLLKQYPDFFKNREFIKQNFEISLPSLPRIPEIFEDAEYKSTFKITGKVGSKYENQSVSFTHKPLYIRNVIQYWFKNKLPDTFNAVDKEPFKAFMVKHFPSIKFQNFDTEEGKESIILYFDRIQNENHVITDQDDYSLFVTSTTNDDINGHVHAFYIHFKKNLDEEEEHAHEPEQPEDNSINLTADDLINKSNAGKIKYPDWTTGDLFDNRRHYHKFTSEAKDEPVGDDGSLIDPDTWVDSSRME